MSLVLREDTSKIRLWKSVGILEPDRLTEANQFKVLKAGRT